MGAVPFFTHSKHENVDDAFWNAHSEACAANGILGYTGTIAEKSSYVVINATTQMEPAKARKLAESLIDREDPRIDDKWGPAGAIRTTEGWLFFGWASI